MSKTPFVTPTSEAALKEIQDAIKEASNAMFRITAEKELIKEIAARMKDEHAMPPADFNKLSRGYFKSEFQKRVDQNESFIELYESIMTGVDPDLTT